MNNKTRKLNTIEGDPTLLTINEDGSGNLVDGSYLVSCTDGDYLIDVVNGLHYIKPLKGADSDS